MARSSVDHLVDSLKDGLSEADQKARDAASAIADKVEDAIDEAQGMSRKVRKELLRRWEVVDKAGRENAFTMALGALGVGILIGYLMGRRD